MDKIKKREAQRSRAKASQRNDSSLIHLYSIMFYVFVHILAATKKALIYAYMCLYVWCLEVYPIFIILFCTLFIYKMWQLF